MNAIRSGSRFDSWFADKDLTEDWTSHNFELWAELLGSLRHQHLEVLEVGCFEGRSGIFWLEFFPLAHVTFVDAFEPGLKGRDMERSSSRFDRNIAPYGERATLLKLKSSIALTMLRNAGKTFDLIYLDGSHRRDDVLVDSLLCWPLLKRDGIAIWDDYGKQEGLRPAERAKEAIELFLSWHADSLIELHRGWQVIVRKTDPRMPPDLAP